jgi:hypothetical protein
MALALLAAPADAQSVPLPTWVRSGTVQPEELAVHAAPSERSARRGGVLAGTRVPIHATLAGEGCGDGRFVQIGERAFVCEHALSTSEAAPWAAPLPASGLPYEYLRARTDGVRAYASLGDVATDDFATALGEGFSIAVATRVEHGSERYVRTRAGLYVAERDLVPARASDFEGVTLSGGRAALERLSFVVGADAKVRSADGKRVLRVLPRLSSVRIAREASATRVEVEGGGLIERARLRRPSLREKPAEVAATEPWIDVDL